jgi:hypothetical protein
MSISTPTPVWRVYYLPVSMLGELTPAEYDHEPDVPISFYHFAFEAESPSALIDKRDELRANGVNVTDIVDHQWSKSI